MTGAGAYITVCGRNDATAGGLIIMTRETMTMNIGESRLDGLLAYLDRLVMAQSAGHKCDREITEVKDAIRQELGLIEKAPGKLEISVKTDDETKKYIDEKIREIMQKAPWQPYNPYEGPKYPMVQWNTITCNSTADTSANGGLLAQATKSAKQTI